MEGAAGSNASSPAVPGGGGSSGGGSTSGGAAAAGGSALQSGRWLQEIYVVEQELVELVMLAAETLDILAKHGSASARTSRATTADPSGMDHGPGAGDPLDDNDAAEEAAAQLKTNIDKYLNLLDNIQYGMRKQFRLLTVEGIGSTLPPFRSNIYAQEKDLDLTSRAIQLALARVKRLSEA